MLLRALIRVHVKYHAPARARPGAYRAAPLQQLHWEIHCKVGAGCGFHALHV